CKFCGKAFIIKTLDSIYCCKKCSEAAYAQKKRAEAKDTICENLVIVIHHPTPCLHLPSPPFTMIVDKHQGFSKKGEG
ncbi:MAG: hypothetical protein K6F78_05635, partial [Bacteroidaceae bacterium]|nr:hypothetical protein [Bacteroidaceae bacterium]